MKKKVYVLMVSKYFPAGHPRKGEPTDFKKKIMLAYSGMSEVTVSNWVNPKTLERTKPIWETDNGKIHTIRENYDLWSARAEKINRGEAVLSLRQWTGSPYNFKRDGSKQEEFLRLEKICVQPIHIEDYRLKVDRMKNKNIYAAVEDRHVNFNNLYKNDGLSFEDFCAWFKMDKGKDLFSMDGCVIHFTDFKY